MRRLKLMLADGNAQSLRQLTQSIPFSALGLDLCGVATNGRHLRDMVLSQQPDLVLADVSLPEQDGLAVLAACRKQGYSGQFVFLSDTPRFAPVQQALRLGAADYLLKPVNPAELNATLERLAALTREASLRNAVARTANLQRQDFLQRAIFDELVRGELSMEEINRRYNCRFQPGLFQMILLRLDCAKSSALTESVALTGEALNPYLAQLDEIAYSALGPLCYDLVLQNKRDGVQMLLNYNTVYGERLPTLLRGAFSTMREALEGEKGLSATLCLSQPDSDLAHMHALMEQCRLAEWQRMRYGLNRILQADPAAPARSPGSTAALRELRRQFFRSIDTLDIPLFQQCMAAFFRQDSQDLLDVHSLRLMRDLREYLLSDRLDMLAPVISANEALERISTAMHSSYTFTQYAQAVGEAYCHILGRMRERRQRQRSRHVRRAMDYISRHYAEPITLETIAAHVDLSTGYFSNHFKKETGQSFVEYLTAYRIKEACGLLQRTNLPVRQVAIAVGIGDSRYFSKLFKKHMGMRPLEYRRVN